MRKFFYSLIATILFNRMQWIYDASAPNFFNQKK